MYITKAFIKNFYSFLGGRKEIAKKSTKSRILTSEICFLPAQAITFSPDKMAEDTMYTVNDFKMV